jgi:short-subunit dehydrogenase
MEVAGHEDLAMIRLRKYRKTRRFVSNASRHLNARNIALGAVGIGAAGAIASLAAGAGVALGIRALWNKLTLDDLRGQSVLITGASRGLGFALAREFARQRCRIAICARSQEELDSAAFELRKAGVDVLTIACDVTLQEDVQKMVQKVIAHYGQIDILVNNAGTIQVGPMQSQTLEDFQEAMDVMFWAHVYTTLAVIPHMTARGRGRIANITSIGGKISVPHLLPYSSAKFAAVGFSEGITAELAKDGITVTTVCPGLMRTGSHENAYFKGDHQKEYAWFSLGASSPITAIGARRAARAIVNAIRRGQAEIILGAPAMAAAMFHGMAPGATVKMLGVTNRFLPRTESLSQERKLGIECKSKLSESPLNMLGRRAANKLNQRAVPKEGFA